MKLPLFSTSMLRLALCCLAPGIPILQAQPAPVSAPSKPRVILIRGADGEEAYGREFDRQTEAWRLAAAAAGADLVTPASPVPGEPAGTTALSRVEKTLTGLDPESPVAVWIVLIGHGTFDGKDARFNLEGPDVSATRMAEWLKPVKSPLVIINTASSSAPFLPALAGPGRVVITATRSGAERNHARFGTHLAHALTDPAADLDQDGRASLLEWFLAASRGTAEFYLEEGRILTEHGLIDDNGDGKGTPADWFRGLRAVSEAKDQTPVDGRLAHQLTLAPDPADRLFTPEQILLRTELESGISRLRAEKASLPEEEYYQKLDPLLSRLAALYQEAGQAAEAAPSPD